MSKTLKIDNLFVSVEGKPILRGVAMTIRQGEIHALMGPNGSGKSTLAWAVMGHPNYTVDRGSVTIESGENGSHSSTNLLEMEPDQRAKAGLFLAFQYPTAIPGVTLANFIRHAVTNVRNPSRKEGEELIPMREFRKELTQQMQDLGIDPGFGRRYLNDGFSGGEKKRVEILQLAMLKPAFAILDETDSGLDSDAVRVVSEGIARLTGGNTGVLVITHHERLLEFNKPQFVHILLGGRIVETGGWELAHDVHANGYAKIREKYPEAAADEDKMAEPKKREPQPALNETS
jgi:Fe-S cluster assembly ATP-binding protein